MWFQVYLSVFWLLVYVSQSSENYHIHWPVNIKPGYGFFCIKLSDGFRMKLFGLGGVMVLAMGGIIILIRGNVLP